MAHTILCEGLQTYARQVSLPFATQPMMRMQRLHSREPSRELYGYTLHPERSCARVLAAAAAVMTVKGEQVLRERTKVLVYPATCRCSRGANNWHPHCVQTLQWGL